MMKKVAGFSYIEIMFTVAILALLAASATPYLENTIVRKKEAELRENLRSIRTAIDAYKTAYDSGKIEKEVGGNGYPKSLRILALGVTDITSPKKNKLRFIRKIPADPMYDGKPVLSHETWGLRSYDSEADDPLAGNDVYDIYSTNQNEGLNGIRYDQW